MILTFMKSFGDISKKSLLSLRCFSSIELFVGLKHIS